ILGDESEPQPDLTLRILSEYGGSSREDEEHYIVGPPELLAEIAHSSRSIDLHAKREDYERAGVVEYLVLCVEEGELHWFHFPSGKMIRPDREGVAKSKVFPGLWIDVPPLLACDDVCIRQAVDNGLASGPHAAFVRRLEAAHRRHRA